MEKPTNSQLHEEKTIQEFEKWSKKYDRGFLQPLFFKPTRKFLLEEIKLNAGDRLIDIGCGTGQLAQALNKKYPDAQITGVDISQSMVDHANRKEFYCKASVSFVVGNSLSLPFEDNTFAVATCVHSFHHYPDKQAALCEIQRVLKPGGKLFLVDGEVDKFWGKFIFKGIIEAVEHEVYHLTAKEMHQLFESCNFKDIRQVYKGFLAPFLVTIGTA